MSNKIIRIILIIVAACIIGALVYNKVKKDDALAAKSSMMGGNGSRSLPVDAYIVKPTVLQNNLDASGTLLSNESIQVQPQISGRVTHIYFKEGTHVSKGDLLVKIFDGDLQAQLEKLKLQKSLAQKMLERQKQLLAINGISQQDVDNTQNQVASAQADIDYALAQIAKTEIRAPFSGIIGLKNISEGAIVSPSTIIANLDQTDPIKLDFSIPEKYRSQLHKGDEITFTVAGTGAKVFEGKVYAIDPAIDLATRTSQARAICPNPDGLLYPGSFANVHIEFKKIPNAIMIPTEAVVPTTRESQVIVIRNGNADFVDVETGIRNADKVQITKGLNIGDTVVTSGVMQASQNAPLKILRIEND